MRNTVWTAIFNWQQLFVDTPSSVIITNHEKVIDDVFVLLLL